MSKNMQMGARFSFFETMSSFNLIEILAETFNLYYPDTTTLKAEAFEESEGLVEYLLQTHKSDNKFKSESPELIKQAIVDFLKPHDKFDIKKLDLLKINAIEILMNITQFSASASIRTFVLCEE